MKQFYSLTCLLLLQSILIFSSTPDTVNTASKNRIVRSRTNFDPQHPLANEKNWDDFYTRHQVHAKRSHVLECFLFVVSQLVEIIPDPTEINSRDLGYQLAPAYQVLPQEK